MRFYAGDTPANRTEAVFIFFIFKCHEGRNVILTIIKATNGSGFWQARGSADWERRLAACPPCVSLGSSL